MASLPTVVLADRRAGPPDGLLVLLHGHDAQPGDVLPLGDHLDPDGRFVVAAPHGPVEIPLADGTLSAAWFAAGPRGPDPESVAASLDALDATIDALCAEHGLTRRHVVLAGFSQGATTTLLFSLTRPGGMRPAGVMALSGYLTDVDGLSFSWRPPFPVLVHHGRADEVVPVEFGHDTAATLTDRGLRVTTVIHDGGHSVPPETLAEARRWLDAVREAFSAQL